MIDKQKLQESFNLHLPIPIKHLKTGNCYVALFRMENCTNANIDQVMVAYVAMSNPNRMFCREINEFCEKFEIDVDKIPEVKDSKINLNG